MATGFVAAANVDWCLMGESMRGQLHMLGGVQDDDDNDDSGGVMIRMIVVLWAGDYQKAV